MPEARRLQQDSEVSGRDNLLGSDVSSRGGSRNFAIDDIANYYSKNGFADPGRYALPYTFVIASNNNVNPGQFAIENNTTQTVTLQSINHVLIHTRTAGGIDSLPIWNFLNNGTIKLQGSLIGNDQHYGLYNISNVSQYVDSGSNLVPNVYRITLTHTSGTPNARLQATEPFSFVPFSAGTGGGGTGNTNLSYTPSPTGGSVNSNTGTNANIPLATQTQAGLQSPGDKTKLDNVASGADDIDFSTALGTGPLVRSARIVDADGNVSNVRLGGGGGAAPSTPTLSMNISGFNSDRFNTQMQNITLTATFDLHAVDTFTSIQFMRGASPEGPAITTAPYTHQVADTGANLVMSTAQFTVVLTYEDQNGTTQTETSDIVTTGPLNKVQPTLSHTYGQRTILTPIAQLNAGEIAYGDMGTFSYTVNETLNGWTGVGSDPISTPDSPITVTDTNTISLVTSRQYNSGGLDSPERTINISIPTVNFTRELYLMYGTISETDYDNLANEQFASSDITDLAARTAGANEVVFGRINPDGYEFDVNVPNGHRIYILYNNSEGDLTQVFDTDHNVNNENFYTKTGVRDGFAQYFSNKPFAATDFSIRLDTR